jgi:8-oxo-dGTP diphosphatase
MRWRARLGKILIAMCGVGHGMEHPSNTRVMENAPLDFQPKVEIAAIYLQFAEQVLFLRLAPPKKEAGRWGVPAGKLESSELPLEAAQRELFEETGIELDLSSWQYLGPIFIRKPDLDYVYHMFSADLAKQPSCRLSSEHDAAQWVSPESAMQMPLMQGASEALTIYLKRIEPPAGGCRWHDRADRSQIRGKW